MTIPDRDKSRSAFEQPLIARPVATGPVRTDDDLKRPLVPSRLRVRNQPLRPGPVRCVHSSEIPHELIGRERQHDTHAEAQIIGHLERFGVRARRGGALELNLASLRVRVALKRREDLADLRATPSQILR